MDSTHLHLMLNHFPILGTFFGIGLLAYGIVAKNKSIQNAAFVLFIFSALISLPVLLSGEGAEEAVEHLPGISEKMIHEHEELAEKAIWLMGFLGIISLFNLFFFIKNKSGAKILSTITLVVSLATFGMMAQVGSLGGQILHTELRGSQNEMPQSNDFEIEENDD